MASPYGEAPPAYEIPTLYDDTHRGGTGMEFAIYSMGNCPNLIGHLEHHDTSTDGSFAICIAGGTGAFVSKALFESIPKEHRPPLNALQTQPVQFLMGGTQRAIGSTIMPIVLTNKQTGQKFKIKLYALVLEQLLMGMFIGRAMPFVQVAFRQGLPTHTLDLGDHGEVLVQGC